MAHKRRAVLIKGKDGLCMVENSGRKIERGKHTSDQPSKILFLLQGFNDSYG